MSPKSKTQITRWITASIFIFSSTVTFAGSVTKVKDNKVLLQLDDTVANANDEFFLLNPEGKKKAIIVIKQIKNGKAVGEVTKGQADVGFTMKAKLASTPTNSTSETEKAEPESETSHSKYKGKLAAGALIGYGMHTLSLTVQNPSIPAQKEDAKLTDSAFSVKGFADYNLSPAITVRGAIGWEPFSAKGTTKQAICESGKSNACQASYNYLGFEGDAFFNFINNKKMKIFLGLGYSYLIQVGKTVTIPNINSENTTNQMVLGTVGMNYFIKGGKGFIPAQVEYAIYPGSTNVQASSIFVRSGYGMTF